MRCFSFTSRVNLRGAFVATAVLITILEGIQIAHGATIGAGTQLGQFGVAGFSGNLTPGYQTAPVGIRSDSINYPFGAASCFARHGALTVTARYVSPDAALGTHFARASAYFADTVTIESAGLSGQPGSFTVAYKLDGSLVANGPDGIDQQVKVYHGWGSDSGDGIIPSMNSYVDLNSMRSWSGWNGGDFGLFVGKMQTATIRFTYGQPFDFWLNIAVQSEIVGSEPGNASAVFSVSDWSGFQGLPEGVSVHSASGVDWTSPVPNHFANPPVSLTSPSAGTLKIHWPARNNIGGFILESANNLSSPGWSEVQQEVTTDAEQHSVVIDTQAQSRFYRLRRP